MSWNEKCAGCFWEEDCRRADIDYYGGCELYDDGFEHFAIGECTDCIFRGTCDSVGDCGDPCEWYWDCEDGAGDDKYYFDILRDSAEDYYEMIREYSDGNAY